MKNIFSVLENKACTGCGICVNICPKQCIQTALNADIGSYKTTLRIEQCVDCGLCQKVCPVYCWSNKHINPYVGNYKEIYSGYSTNKLHRSDSASGGLTTSILAYLLSKGFVDAVVVAFRKEGNPLECEMRIVTSCEDVYNSKGSIYSPTSYCNIVKQMRQSRYSRFAIVGLPCHIEGLSRLCEFDKKLKEQIILKIALLCGHTPSMNAYHYSLRHLNITLSEVKMIHNRGDGWPGFMRFEMKNGEKIKIPHGSKYSWGQTLGSLLFTPSGCKHCSDATGYSADISVCDAWLSKYKSDNKGRNLLLLRSEMAVNILKAMCKENIVVLTEESLDDFIVANESVFKEKIHINTIRNADLVHKNGLFPNVSYIKPSNYKSLFFTNILVVFEKIPVNKTSINNYLLFIFKLIKYLSLKWTHLKKY